MQTRDQSQVDLESLLKTRIEQELNGAISNLSFDDIVNEELGENQSLTPPRIFPGTAALARRGG